MPDRGKYLRLFCQVKDPEKTCQVSTIKGDLSGFQNLTGLLDSQNPTRLHPKEKELIKQILLFPETVQLAAENYSPALIANYTYDLVKEFNSFYQQVSILGETEGPKRILRVQLSKKVGEIIASGFALLGIGVPERM